MRLKLIAILVFSLALGGCSSKQLWGWPSDHWREQDFKPYVTAQMNSIPNAYPVEPWTYPAGTSTKDIVSRWKAAGLITSVTNGDRRGIFMARTNVPSIYVGPNFYNLAPSSQQGFLLTVNQIYAIKDNAMLYDSHTGKAVGAFADGRLQLY